MSKLLKRLNPEISAYKDRRFDGDEADWERALRTSTTVYVGNLSFFTREEQIYEVFSKVGHLERVIMGLDKYNKTPCGFCFVSYYTRSDAEHCVKYLNGTVLDDRAIRVDHDWGFVEGRQWGRGRSGGQVRDEFRVDYDPGRGGFGKVVQKEIVQQQQQIMASGGSGSGAGIDSLASPLDGRGDPKRRRTEFGGGARQRGFVSGGSGGANNNSSRPANDNPRFRGERDKDEDED